MLGFLVSTTRKRMNTKNQIVPWAVGTFVGFLVLLNLYRSLFTSHTTSPPEIHHKVVARVATENVKTSFTLTNAQDLLEKFNSLLFKHRKNSHLLPVSLAALATKSGSYLELGFNHNTTELLRHIVQKHNRSLITVDLNSDWLVKFKDFKLDKSDYHKVYLLEENDFATYGHDKNWAVVFINGEVRHRLASEHLLKLAQKSHLVVLVNAVNSITDATLFKYNCHFTIGQGSSSYKVSILSSSLNIRVIKDIVQKLDDSLVKAECNSHVMYDD